jgi:hypothetical protein
MAGIQTTISQILESELHLVVIGKFKSLFAIALLAVAANGFIAGCGSLIVTQKSAEELRAAKDFAWVAESDRGVRVFAEAGTQSAKSLSTTADQAVQARGTVLSALQITAYDADISIFVVENRERMEKLIGRQTNATIFHEANVMCVVWSEHSDRVQHEMVHIVAMNEWGVPQRWINEGLAVDVTGLWVGRNVDAVCKILQERGELPSLDELTRRFDGFKSAVSYPAAGSFVRFVRETYGLETVRRIWNDGWRSIPEHTGNEWNEIELMWQARIDNTHVDGVVYDPVSVTPPDDRQQ